MKNSVSLQIEHHIVAIISLCIAIIALVFTTWREQSTEKNRTTRMAGFEVLKNLGELQIIVNVAFYDHKSMKENPLAGWGRITFISDLSELIPPPAKAAAEHLVVVWKENADQIDTNEQAVDRVSKAIDSSRQATLEAIRELH